MSVFVLLCLFTSVRGRCDPDFVHFTNYRHFPKRSIPYYLEVSAEKCREYDNLYFEWYVTTEDGQNVSELTSDTPFLKIDGFKITSIPVFSTILAARVKISHHRDFSEYINDALHFRFRPDNIFMYIIGGLKRTYPVGKDIILDAKSGSRDLSFSPEEDAFVGNIINWSSRPPLRVKLPDSLIWELPSKLFRRGRTYTFTVKMRRTKFPGFEETASVFQEVTFLENIPILSIECISNCIYSHWQHTTAFQLTCTGDCGAENYTWYSTPNIIDENSAEFGNGTSKLLIKPGVPSPGKVYYFGAKLLKAEVSIGMRCMKSISRGVCFVEPKSGIAGYTQFKINCFNFFSYYGYLTYLVYQGDVQTDEKAVLVAYSSSEVIKDILLAEGYSKLTIIVQDAFLMKEYVDVGFVNVESLKNALKPNHNLIDFVKTIVLGNGPISLNTHLVGNNHDKLVQMSSVLLTTILNFPASVKRDLTLHIAQMLASVKMVNIMLAAQLVSVMWKLVETKEERNTFVTIFQADILTGAAEVLYEYASDPREEFIPITFIIEFGKKLLDLFCELLTRNKELLPLMQTEMEPHEYDSYDEMSSKKITVRFDFAHTMAQLLKTSEVISKSILGKMIVDQSAIKIETKAWQLSVRRIHPSLLLQDIRNESEALFQVKFPPSVVDDLVSRFEYIDYEYLRFSKDPFWWHINQELLNTEYLEFDIWGGGRKLKRLADYIDIEMKITKTSPADQIISGTLAPDGMDIYRLEIMGNTMLKIELMGRSMVRLVLQDCPPTKKDVKLNGNIASSLLHVSHEKETIEKYLGILNEEKKDLIYNGTIQNYICVTWDLPTKKFIRGGFLISEYVNGSLHCKTSHLSLFGGVFGVPPNKIEMPVDLDIVLFIETNLLVIVVLIFVYCLWFFLMLWAIARDRRLQKKNIVFLLPDTVPGDEYGYLLVVVTGTDFDAGTTANVAFQLVGTQAESRPHLITTNAYEVLQRNSEDWFLIYCPRHLGEIVAIRLWHNCRGRKPHWYCSRIIVQELKSGNQYCFVIEKWFSLIWGDSEISREIPVTTTEGMKQTNVIFPVLLSRKFRDGHLWISIFSNSPQSNFTTKERVTVAISLALMSLLVSGMFYGIPKRDPSDAIFSQGSFYITSREILIFLESLVVSFPVAFILVILFKKSGPPPLNIGKGKKKE